MFNSRKKKREEAERAEQARIEAERQRIEAEQSLTREQAKKKSKGKNILLWILGGFFVLSGLVCLPSIGSILMILAGIITMPIPPLQALIPKKGIKALIIAALFLVGCGLTPDSITAGDNTPAGNEKVIEQGIVEEANKEEKKADKEKKEENNKKDKAEESQKQEEESGKAIAANSKFEVYFLDVGQADASIILCDDKAMMIDGGNVADSSFIYTFLKNNNISHLDYMIASHAHEDHIGGLSGALNYATVDKVYCPTTSYDSEAFENLEKSLAKQGKEITIPKAGDTFAFGSANVEILAPSKHYEDENNNSIVLRITYGDTSFLFAGDANLDEETDILNAGYTVKSTLLKVAHHGGSNATNYRFLREVAPKYGVIMVGSDNSYGHPTEDTLSRLKDAEVKVYRTDLQGTIKCISDGKNLSFTVDKNGSTDTYAPPKQTITQSGGNGSGDGGTRTTPAIPDNDTPAPAGTTYVLNGNSMKFHIPSCPSVGKMKESNKIYFTGTRDEVIAKGYSPCGNCHP